MKLVRDHWYAVLSADEVPLGKPIGVRRLGLDLVVWRDQKGQPRAAVDRCPHRWAKLSLGRIVDGCVECPFHGWRFDADGSCTSIPAHPERPISGAAALDTLTLTEDHGFIWAWVGPGAPDGPPPFFDFSGYTWAGSAFTAEWPVSHTRSVENQLDFTHLPFVHRSSIGRGLPVDKEVITEADGDLIRFGSAGSGIMIDFLGPSIWRLPTGPVWQFLAFVPIDEERMIYYSRAYQGMVSVPGLSWMIGKVGAVFSQRVLRQDEAVVCSQPPGATRLRMGELLVPSDGPIIAYRRWREARLVDLDVVLGLKANES